MRPSLPHFPPSPAGDSIKILRADEGQTNLHAFAIIVALTTIEHEGEKEGGRRYPFFDHLPFSNWGHRFSSVPDEFPTSSVLILPDKAYNSFAVSVSYLDT